MRTYAIIEPGVERSVAARRIAVFQEKTGDRQGARVTLQSIDKNIAAAECLGILRPMILLPPIALSGWSVEQLEMVLLS